jgi:hypothetical protein
MESHDCSAQMEAPMESQKQEVYAAIERDVLDLKTSMDIMHELIHMQQDDLNTIEDFIHFTKNEVKMAETSLIVAEEIKGNNWYLQGMMGLVGVMGFVGLVGLF